MQWSPDNPLEGYSTQKLGPTQFLKQYVKRAKEDAFLKVPIIFWDHTSLEERQAGE